MPFTSRLFYSCIRSNNAASGWLLVGLGQRDFLRLWSEVQKSWRSFLTPFSTSWAPLKAMGRWKDVLCILFVPHSVFSVHLAPQKKHSPLQPIATFKAAAWPGLGYAFFSIATSNSVFFTASKSATGSFAPPAAFGFENLIRLRKTRIVVTFGARSASYLRSSYFATAPYP